MLFLSMQAVRGMSNAVMSVFNSGLNESAEQGMRPVGPGFQFRVGLCGYEPGMAGKFDHLHDTAVRRKTGELQSVLLQHTAIVIVYFIAMSVTLIDRLCVIELISGRIFIQDTGI